MNNLAAAYLRVSTDEQAEHGYSLPAQKERLGAFITAQGWNLYNFYIDDGYSGKDLERPAMQKLIADAQNKKFNYIVVIKLDRLSRRQKDVLHLIEDVFEVAEVGFRSVTEPFDTTTPFGKAAIGMMAVFAQLERETTVERVKMAKKEAAKQGRFGGGGVAYGYKHDMVNKSLYIDDETAPTIELIYSLYESGQYGFRSLALELVNRGISAPEGDIWYKDTIKKILLNPTYAGYIPRCGELNEGKHDAIISRDRWEKVQIMIKEKYMPRPSKDPTNLLTGLLYCGNCGARMRFKTQNWKDPKGTGKVWTKRYYICYSRAKYDRMIKDINCKLPFISVEKLNEGVINYLTNLSLSPQLMEKSIQKSLKKYDHSSSDKELNVIKKEINGIQKKIDRWNNAYENGAIEVSELSRRTQNLRDKRTLLEQQKLDIETLLEDSNKAIISANEIMEQLKSFAEIWKAADSAEQRIIISALVERVTAFDADHFEVSLNI